MKKDYKPPDPDNGAAGCGTIFVVWLGTFFAAGIGSVFSSSAPHRGVIFGGGGIVGGLSGAGTDVVILLFCGLFLLILLFVAFAAATDNGRPPALGVLAVVLYAAHCVGVMAVTSSTSSGGAVPAVLYGSVLVAIVVLRAVLGTSRCRDHHTSCVPGDCGALDRLWLGRDWSAAVPVKNHRRRVRRSARRCLDRAVRCPPMRSDGAASRTQRRCVSVSPGDGQNL